MKHRSIEILSSILILIFAYTGLTKLADLERFRAIISLSPVISWGANVLSLILPIIEIITALLLFIPSSRKWGLFVSLFLMCLFTLYIGYMTFFAPDRTCSCGGVLEDLSWQGHFIFNIVLTGLAGAGIWLYNKNIIAINRESRKPV